MSEKNLKKAAIGYLVGEWEESEEGGQGVLEGADGGHMGPDTRQTDQAVILHVPAAGLYKTRVPELDQAKPNQHKESNLMYLVLHFTLKRFEQGVVK